MRYVATDKSGRQCQCGALCQPNRTLCRKCHFRFRWYRRKSWRINPSRHLTQHTSERSDTA